MLTRVILGIFAMVLTTVANVAHAQDGKSFADQLGRAPIGDVEQDGPWNVGYILWGADLITFNANGNDLTTQRGSLFDEKGLNINLVSCDDPYEAIRRYMAGDLHVLRMTGTMAALAADVINADPRTRTHYLLQMSWSGGDHLVVRGNIKTVGDMKGKTFAVQRGGPHIKLMNDALATDGLTWGDINVVWADTITGPGSAAELFKNDQNIDGCTVVTPDMFGLTGGLQAIGDGRDGTINGSRVLVSTAELSRSIADCFFIRADFWDSNRAEVEAFAAAWLKSAEQMVQMSAEYDDRGNADYEDVLRFAVETYGKVALPNEAEAHGLFLDARIVGYPGQIVFFEESNNPVGFDKFSDETIGIARTLGYVRNPNSFLPTPLNWGSRSFVGYLDNTNVQRKERFNEEIVAEIENFDLGDFDDRTITKFEINFDVGQADFPYARFASSFDRVLEQLPRYGSAAIVIRGHADPTATLRDIVRAGKELGVITNQQGEGADAVYTISGRPVRITSIENLIQLVEGGAFDGAGVANPRETFSAAIRLASNRGESVRQILIEEAEKRGVYLDPSQIQVQGVGIREPLYARPSGSGSMPARGTPEFNQWMDEARRQAAANRRIEFRLIRVSAEAQNAQDFDF